MPSESQRRKQASLSHVFVLGLMWVLSHSGRLAPDGSPDSLEHYQSRYSQSNQPKRAFEPSAVPEFHKAPYVQTQLGILPVVLVPTPPPPTPKQPEPAPPNGGHHGHGLSRPRAPRAARAASAPAILHDRKILCQVCQKVALGIRWLTCKLCKNPTALAPPDGPDGPDGPGPDPKPTKLPQLCPGHRRSNAFVGCEYARCLA